MRTHKFKENIFISSLFMGEEHLFTQGRQVAALQIFAAGEQAGVFLHHVLAAFVDEAILGSTDRKI